jgi:hypothetical protein
VVAHPISEYARQAYAAGWAASGGPLTDRVRAGCTAAVRLAIEHADDPQVLEVTVDLGRLEGLWATLFDRRQALIDRHTSSVTAAWRVLVAALGIAEAVRAFRARADRRPDDLTADAAAALVAARALLAGLPDMPGWPELQAAIVDAVRDGYAEGVAAAAAIGADSAGGKQRLDWDRAFEAVLAALRTNSPATVDSDRWLRQLIDRAIIDTARELAAAEDAATDEDLTDTIRARLNDPAIAHFTVDWAITTAAATAGRAFYRTDGATEISIVTVGDGRVCAACEDAEARSPWPAAEAPDLPIHPRCRCTYTADIDPSRYPDWFN